GRREGRRGGQRRALLRLADMPPCAGGLFRLWRSQGVGDPETLLSGEALIAAARSRLGQSQGTRSFQLLPPAAFFASAFSRRCFLNSSSPSSSAAAVSAGWRYSIGGSVSVRRTVGLPCLVAASCSR